MLCVYFLIPHTSVHPCSWGFGGWRELKDPEMGKNVDACSSVLATVRVHRLAKVQRSRKGKKKGLGSSGGAGYAKSPTPDERIFADEKEKNPA